MLSTQNIIFNNIYIHSSRLEIEDTTHAIDMVPLIKMEAQQMPSTFIL